MDVTYPAFGSIVVDGERYDHDVVIEDGTVRVRDKGPSRAKKAELGHTPLTAAEPLPWSRPRLIIGSGYSGRLPVLDDVHDAASNHGVVVEVMPTAEACRLLRELDARDANAVLHVTC